MWSVRLRFMFFVKAPFSLVRSRHLPTPLGCNYIVNVRPMNGVSFPAHVAVIIRRLATIRLPNWLDYWSWPHLLSFVLLDVNHAQPETDTLPPRPLEPIEPPERPQKNHDKKHQKGPPQDRVELPRQEPKVKPPDIIHQLLVNPALYDPLLIPRYPIVLCHGLFSMCHFLNINLFEKIGLYGFDSRGPTSFPSMRMHYWSNVLRILRGKIGAEVIVTSVPGFVSRFSYLLHFY